MRIVSFYPLKPTAATYSNNASVNEVLISTQAGSQILQKQIFSRSVSQFLTRSFLHLHVLKALGCRAHIQKGRKKREIGRKMKSQKKIGHGNLFSAQGRATD